MSLELKKQPKADAPRNPVRFGVIPMMMGVVLLGMLAGATLAWLAMPDLMAAAALGGGMMFGAVRVFAYLFAEPAVLAQDAPHDEKDPS